VNLNLWPAPDRHLKSMIDRADRNGIDRDVKFHQQPIQKTAQSSRFRLGLGFRNLIWGSRHLVQG